MALLIVAPIPITAMLVIIALVVDSVSRVTGYRKKHGENDCAQNTEFYIPFHNKCFKKLNNT
jgi:hypothetical protein